jgi:NAD(P)-dependent dehydrogenase (short-subunit alcohol dehydrogenase family)
MCTACGDLNYRKRFQSASLEGQVAIITGSRLKIGYHATLMMLRAGAHVVATTRFPVDSAIRFSKEQDYPVWKDRLQIYGLDLRHTPSVEIFCRYMQQSLDRLDILINNAAQTVRRPPGFYAHMMEKELLPFSSLSPEARHLLEKHESCKSELNRLVSHSSESALPVAWHGAGPGIGLRASAQLSQIPYTYDNSLAVEEVFPKGKLDADLQQVDLRTVNSWRLKLADVPAPEMLEVQLVNAVAPFVLCSQLAPIMRRDNTGMKHIVNVTAMEGKFYRFKKEDRHPHTNMAKAALNMLTHTSASDLAKDGIYMNAVDTGWVTDEDPVQLAKLKENVHDFQPPLDIVDGAARVCDPFFDGILTGQHWCGKFLKDYFPIDW